MGPPDDQGPPVADGPPPDVPEPPDQTPVAPWLLLGAAPLAAPDTVSADGVDVRTRRAHGAWLYRSPLHVPRTSRSPLSRLPWPAWLRHPAVLLLATVVAGAIWLWPHRTQEIDPGPRDRSLVLTIDDVSRRSAVGRVLRSAEHFEQSFPVAGGELRTYTYTPPDPTAPRLHSTSRFFDTERAATEMFRLAPLGTTLDWGLGRSSGEVGLVRLDEERPWGDESRAYAVRLDGAHVGYDVSARIGSSVVFVRLRNVELSGAEGLRAIVAPALARVGRASVRR